MIDRAKGARWALLVCATLGLTSIGSAFAATGSLKGNELRETIGGHTVLLKTGMGFEVPISYRTNGTMAGRVQAMAAALAGESRPHDNGRWWVTETQLCQRWSNWLDGKTYCFDLVRKGSLVHWRSSDGYTGTARIR
jgi:hypothetical protein